MSIFIENILHQEQTTNIIIEDNIITGIGKQLQMPVNAMYIDGSGQAVFPALANTHTHAAMTLFRGYGDDHDLSVWLNEYIFPKEKNLTPDMIYWGTRLACLEMIKSGTACINDMYFFTPEVIRAVADSGIRATIGYSVADLFDTETAEHHKQVCSSLEQLFTNTYEGRLHYSAAPHSIYTVSGETLQWLSAWAKDNDLLFHMHMSETIREVNDCIAVHGCRPYEYLDKLGILDVCGDRFIGAHSLWLSPHEIDLLAQHHGNVVHNPNSNLKLASGHAFPYIELHEAGVNVALGTDGCSSSNNLDMIEASKVMSLLQKGWRQDPTVLPASETLAVASSNGYSAMRFNGGSIEVGKLADLMLVDLNNIAFIPNNDTLSNLVYAAHGDCVGTMICNGKVLMKDRVVPDEQEIIHQIRRLA